LTPKLVVQEPERAGTETAVIAGKFFQPRSFL
jgi:hypothetical protein